MKNKPILIVVAIIVLLGAAIFLFARYRKASRPEVVEINQFLYAFSNKVDEGNADSLYSYFEGGKKSTSLKKLVNLLSGKKTYGNSGKPIANIKFDVEASDIKIIDADLSIITIPVKFSHDSLESRQSNLTLRIKKLGPHKFKITQADARKFLTDYVAYEGFVRSKIINDKDFYSPITLAAFKTADQLKTKYDSVVWFNHVDGKTFFYVIKGKLSEGFTWWEENVVNKPESFKPSVFKMGLVNPDLKEIIPVEYDLVHNIGGTIEGLIEVEKDNKKGFFNLDGNIVVPAKYSQILPLENDEYLALLKENSDYYYLKKDLTITDKVDIKITDVLSKVRMLDNSYSLTQESSKNIMEINSRGDFTSLIVSPSYLVELQILPKYIHFQNSLRKPSEEDEGDGNGSITMKVNYTGTQRQEGNWFENIYYSLVDHFLGGRTEFYEKKKVLMVDKKQNKILGFDASAYYGGFDGDEILSGKCDENYFRAINDSLFEFKTTSYLGQLLLDSTKQLEEGPYYHYLTIKDGKLVALPNERIFSPTKYVKMDDSYLSGCFVLGGKPIGHITPEILQVMKNEIYASYGYKFKNKRWNEIFEIRFSRSVDDDKLKNNVDDSLTVIDKYNINWIDNKLKQMQKPATHTLAAK